MQQRHGESAFQPLAESLRAEIEQGRDKVLLLLSFIYDRQSILTARDNLQSSSREKRAYAAEILEVTLPQEVKELTLPLTEDLEPGERLEKLERRFPQEKRHWTWLLREIFARNDRKICNWTKACAIYGAATSSSGNGFEDDLVRLSKGSNPLVAETSRWALQADRRDRSRGMLTIEKVILLKGVGMFAHTSEDILADVAAILEEVELTPGEPVFHKGEQGDSMYIIIHGRVRISTERRRSTFSESARYSESSHSSIPSRAPHRSRQSKRRSCSGWNAVLCSSSWKTMSVWSAASCTCYVAACGG